MTGRRVISYAQWRSQEDWAASGRSFTDEGSEAILEVAKKYGAKPLQGKAGFYRVARVIDNTTQSKQVLELGKLPEVLKRVTKPLNNFNYDSQVS